MTVDHVLLGSTPSVGTGPNARRDYISEVAHEEERRAIPEKRVRVLPIEQHPISSIPCRLMVL